VRWGRLTVLLTLIAMAGTITAGASAVGSAAAHGYIVNEGQDFVTIEAESRWALQDSQGRLYLDFTENNDNALGKGFNPQAVTGIGAAFSISNNGEDAVHAWLESPELEEVVGELGVEVRYFIDDSETSPAVIGHLVAASVYEDEGNPHPNILELPGLDESVYALLEPGESVVIAVEVDTTGYHGSPGSDFSHTLVVCAEPQGTDEDNGDGEDDDDNGDESSPVDKPSEPPVGPPEPEQPTIIQVPPEPPTDEPLPETGGTILPIVLGLVLTVGGLLARRIVLRRRPE